MSMEEEKDGKGWRRKMKKIFGPKRGEEQRRKIYGPRRRRTKKEKIWSWEAKKNGGGEEYKIFGEINGDANQPTN